MLWRLPLLLLASSDALLQTNEDSSCSSPQMTFHEFAAKHSRSYASGSDEYQMREGLFRQRADEVFKHNCRSGKQQGWKKGINRFADWTEEERMKLIGRRDGARAAAPEAPAKLRFDAHEEHFGLSDSTDAPEEADLPEEKSWQHLDAISGEADQGSCGSCWALSGETIMRAHREAIGKPAKFSVDTLISCVPNPKHCGGTGGCHGATAALSYEFALTYGLRAREAEAMKHPIAYFGEPMKCPEDFTPKNASFESGFVETKRGNLLHRAPRQRALVKHGHKALGGWESMQMYGWMKLARNKVHPIKYALVNLGPLTVSLAVGNAWFSYFNGVMPLEDGCDPERVSSHGIVLAGYGKTSSGQLWWQLKNSWGNDWGELGFIRLARQSDEEEEADCGWNHRPSSGSGCDDGPSKVWVCGTCNMLYDGALPLFKDPDTLEL